MSMTLTVQLPDLNPSIYYLILRTLAWDSKPASNGADLVDIDNGNLGLPNSSTTGANQVISSAITMPTTGHQIDTRVYNSTGIIAASRILAQYGFIATVTISGTVYSDEGVTKTTSNIMLAVNGTVAYSTSTESDNTYKFDNVAQPSAGDIITVWMNNNGGASGTGAVVTRYNSGDLSGLDIYKDRLITRHEDSGPLTNANLGVCDKNGGAQCADADLHFDVTTSTNVMTVDNDWRLYIWSGTTFSPGATTTLATGGSAFSTGGDLKFSSSTSVLNATSNTIFVGGDWINDAGGTFSKSSNQLVVMNATTTGFTMSGLMTGSSTFEKLQFNGTSTSAWTIQDALRVNATTTDALAQNYGTVTLGNSGGDDMFVMGGWKIANNANETSTFQTTAVSNVEPPITIALNARDPSTSGLVGYRKLDEKPINHLSTTTDSSGTGNNGTANTSDGTMDKSVVGQINTAMNFDGVDDYVDVESPASLDNLPAMTISGWMKPRTMGESSQGRIMEKRGLGGNAGWEFSLNGTNAIEVVVDHETTDLVHRTSNSVFSFNVWTHVALTWDGSTSASNARIYINGVETTYQTSQNAVDARIDENANNVVIGNRSASKIVTFDGLLDEIRVYNRVLTASEVATLYNPASCPNCVITVGATSGSGQGSFKLAKNTSLQLNPRASATASDAGVEVESTGYLEVLGSQDTTSTVNTIAEDTNSTTITVSGTPWGSNNFINESVRITNTTSLAFSRVYDILATSSNSITFNATTSPRDTNAGVVVGAGCTGAATCDVTVSSTFVTATKQNVGKYLHNLTDSAYYQIAKTTDGGGAASDTITIVTGKPDSFTTMTDGDDVEITDGIRAGDIFEILDYAHITAENGTACTATVNQSGDGYIWAKAGSQTLIQYADICNLGRGSAGKNGVTANTVNGATANEGFSAIDSRIHSGYEGIYLSASTNNNNISGNSIYSNADTGILLDSSANSNTFSGNRTYSNTNYGIHLTGSSNNGLISNNSSYAGSVNGIRLDTSSNNNTLTSNDSYANAVYGIQLLGSSNNILTSNSVYSNLDFGINLNTASNNTLTSNDSYAISGQGFGIYFQGGSNNTLTSNNSYSNTIYGIHLNGSSNNTLSGNNVYGNTSWGIRVFASNNNVLSSNQIYGNNYGLVLADTTAHTGNISVNDTLSSGTANSIADIEATSTGAHTLKLYNDQLLATDEVGSVVSAANAYIISYKHDALSTSTKLWGEYTVPADVAETP